MTDMRVSSQKSSPEPQSRAPKRQRGHERVAVLLAAAAKVFLEKGYDAATMTEIAAAANSSIGSLYQFFPTKLLLAEALHIDRLQQLNNGLAELAEGIRGQTAAEIGDAIFTRLGRFIEEYPEFLVLAARRDVPKERKAKSRAELRASITALLKNAEPSVERDIDLLASLVLELLRIIVAAAYDPDGSGDPRLVSELRRMLRKRLEEVTP
ncbi:TetR/AcrR family transcriptional regulator [Rhizobium sp. P32RR-XVIII]|uniref:TetR/AcrR family transcriptional regulator n=1 Tax=Rhizobium sp. P32RR-XVIII TaxID=2726738 RepID=UPI0014563254|nr:TetR/AcrR family transcriptional regulator [Rhizobium sp. P32RR-XVIII]NLS01860.1 TetR/AcrR family transcriptional regulator [Rhizobium sp. P32RR-XVIII]